MPENTFRITDSGLSAIGLSGCEIGQRDLPAGTGTLDEANGSVGHSTIADWTEAGVGAAVGGQTVVTEPKDSSPSGRNEIRTGPQPMAKVAQLVDRLKAHDGAGLARLQVLTGWQRHTIHAAISRLRKAGIAIVSDRRRGNATVYRPVTLSDAEIGSSGTTAASVEVGMAVSLSGGMSLANAADEQERRSPWPSLVPPARGPHDPQPEHRPRRHALPPRLRPSTTLMVPRSESAGALCLECLRPSSCGDPLAEVRRPRFAGSKLWRPPQALLKRFATIAETERLGGISDLPGVPAVKPGTRLVRVFAGKTCTVTVEEEGFIWNGERYSSLTAIARTITGTNWNGWAFFGIKRRLMRNKNAAKKAVARNQQTSSKAPRSSSGRQLGEALDG